MPKRVIVVGAGNAGFCAALSARESGADVTVLERAPKAVSGGNSRFTAGAMRFAYRNVEDLQKLIPSLSENEIECTDFGQYDETQFFDDMGRITQYRCDPDRVEQLVYRSRDTLMWMKQKGVRFMPIYGRQAFRHNGKFKFWGGLTVETHGGGPGLIKTLTQVTEAEGINIHYACRALKLIQMNGAVRGVNVKQQGNCFNIDADAVVLASGGFEANQEWRARYLGPGWDLARVRGSRFNTGDGIRMALDIGATSYGHWSGCHAVGWDMNAPEFGDLAIGDGFQKHSYPFGIMLNAEGLRFVDEGADFRNYTYARYGARILAQKEQYAWQIFDQKVMHLLRDEYRIKQVTRLKADTLDELIGKMAGVNHQQALKTIEAFNAAVKLEVEFNPNIKDGRAAAGLEIPKSNWANRLDTGPYEAYQVTCGITFTFGGLRINDNAQVLDADLEPIEGLYAAGELVGGIFYHNYPGGTGLTSGAVFGRIAGKAAAHKAILSDER